MFSSGLLTRAQAIITAAESKHWRIATAESCTGGLLVALLTEVAGASRVIGRSFVTYSNRSKHEILHVSAELLQTHGAVSEAVVKAMAQNLFDMSSAHLTIAISGIAGPGGGSIDKPVGTVHLATATADDCVHRLAQYGDIGRAQIRHATLDTALLMLDERL